MLTTQAAVQSGAKADLSSMDLRKSGLLEVRQVVTPPAEIIGVTNE
jgi:hypothetical protein